MSSSKFYLEQHECINTIDAIMHLKSMGKLILAQENNYGTHDLVWCQVLHYMTKQIWGLLSELALILYVRNLNTNPTFTGVEMWIRSNLSMWTDRENHNIIFIKLYGNMKSSM